MIKILIVEDSDMKFDDIQKSIDFLDDCEIVRKCTRNEALQLLYIEGNDFDVIILDMQFPSMIGGEMLRDGGVQVLKKIRHRNINTPVIFCSSSACAIPNMPNVVGYIVYGGNGKLSELLEHYIESALISCEKCQRDQTDYCYKCKHGFYGSNDEEHNKRYDLTEYYKPIESNLLS